MWRNTPNIFCCPPIVTTSSDARCVWILVDRRRRWVDGSVKPGITSNAADFGRCTAFMLLSSTHSSPFSLWERCIMSFRPLKEILWKLSFGGFKREEGCNKTLDVCVCAAGTICRFTSTCLWRLIAAAHGSSAVVQVSENLQKLWKDSVKALSQLKILREKLPHSVPERRTALLSNSSSFSLFYFGTGRS